MNGRHCSGDPSYGNKEHVIGNWRKGDSGYKVAKNLVELGSCSSLLWKLDL